MLFLCVDSLMVMSVSLPKSKKKKQADNRTLMERKHHRPRGRKNSAPLTGRTMVATDQFLYELHVTQLRPQLRHSNGEFLEVSLRLQRPRGRRASCRGPINAAVHDHVPWPTSTGVLRWHG